MLRIFQQLRANLHFGYSIGIPPEDIKRLVHESGAEPWHIHAIVRRNYRRHTCVACDWLASSLPLDATIFETACGSGANLLWLAQKGFRKLHGIDISNEALWLCQGLAQLKRVHLDVWQENALSPSNSKTRDLFSQGIDAILSLSWLQHVPNADLGEFLKIYHPCLNLDGIIIFDMITHDYDTVRNNQYHSDDWNLPVSQRRPSEYRMRMSTEEIQDLAKNTGYIYERGITLMTLISGHPQRSVHMLRRSGSWTGLPNLSG